MKYAQVCVTRIRQLYARSRPPNMQLLCGLPWNMAAYLMMPLCLNWVGWGLEGVWEGSEGELEDVKGGLKRNQSASTLQRR